MNRRHGVLFVHGFLGDNNDLAHIGKRFARSHNVLYLSPQDVSHFLAKTTLPWHLVGYSMGGRMALQGACLYPNRVCGLTLISASPGITDARERRRRWLADKSLSKALDKVSIREFINAWYRQPLFKEFRKHRNFAALRQRRLQISAPLIKQMLLLCGTGAQKPLWHGLQSLSVPAQLIVGELDVKFCDIARRMNDCNPQIQRMVVAKVGHVVHWEAPNAVIQGILNVEGRMAAGSKL